MCVGGGHELSCRYHERMRRTVTHSCPTTGTWPYCRTVRLRQLTSSIEGMRTWYGSLRLMRSYSFSRPMYTSLVSSLFGWRRLGNRTERCSALLRFGQGQRRGEVSTTTALVLV